MISIGQLLFNKHGVTQVKESFCSFRHLIPLSLPPRGSCYSCKSFKKFNVLCLFSTKHTICERVVNTAEHLLAMELHISLRRWLRGKNENWREWLLDSDFHLATHAYHTYACSSLNPYRIFRCILYVNADGIWNVQSAQSQGR